MQENICIKNWFATIPIRGPGRAYDKSSCVMKNQQNGLETSQSIDSSIHCKKMELTTLSSLATRTNVKKSDHIYNGRTQDQFKKSVLYSNNLNVIWDKHKSA